MLNDNWAAADEKPYLNYTLFGTIGGYPTNYYTFKAITGMVCGCVGVCINIKGARTIQLLSQTIPPPYAGATSGLQKWHSAVLCGELHDL
jgi:hypothetical protein